MILQIQNEFLDDVSKEVIVLIMIEAKATKFSSIVADTTMNISKMNKFSLTAYLLCDQDSSDSVERFVCCKNIDNSESEILYDVMSATIQDLGMDLQFCQGQAYEGVSNIFVSISV